MEAILLLNLPRSHAGAWERGKKLSLSQKGRNNQVFYKFLLGTFINSAKVPASMFKTHKYFSAGYQAYLFLVLILFIGSVVKSPSFAEEKHFSSYYFPLISAKRFFEIAATSNNLELDFKAKDKNIGVDIHSSSWQEALLQVAKLHGYKVKLEPKKLTVSNLPKKPVIKKSPQQITKKPKKATQAKPPQEPLLKKKWHSYKLQHTKAEKLLEQIHKLTTSHKIEIYALAEDNSLIYLVDTDQQALIQKLIDSLDKSPSHVLISASIFTSRSEVARAIGARWGGQANIGSNLQLTGGRNGSIQGETINLGDALATDFGSLAQSNVNLALGLQDGNSILDLELSLLHSQGEISLLAAPQIMTLSSQKALIYSGSEVPYQSVFNNTVAITYKNAALSLEVTPEVVGDKIHMVIEIHNDTVGSSTYNSLPSIDVNKIETQVEVASGENVVLGGVTRNSRESLQDEVPWLGSVPLIGGLFRGSYEREVESEMTIVITPYLIQDKKRQEINSFDYSLRSDFSSFPNSSEETRQ